jgi:ATP-dependent RNA helicase RhlB
MLFSATLNAWVKNLAWEYTKKPIEIEIEPEVVTVEEITQILYHVPSEDKMKLLMGILEQKKPESLIVFCNTKKHTEIVAKRLKINGYTCEFIIGDLPQVKRQKVIDDVKAGKINILVATDVAARGLDIESLAMVINYDLPVEAENYVHRIGRTARAGKTGMAITLASEQDVYELPAVERYIGKKIPSEIAGQELYGTDKSAGQYIQTEFYEERHQHGASRPQKGGGKRRDDKRDGRKRSAPSAEHRKDHISGKRKHDAVHQGQGRPQERQGKGEARKGEARKGDRRHERPQQQVTAQLSMEERMALYKKKYASGEAKHSGHKEHTAPKVKHHQHEKPKAKEAASAAPAKKGVLSKLIGLFKKK